MDILKQAIQASINTLAPAPPLLEDFLYHWKRFMNNYLNLSSASKVTVESTNLPDCLDRLRTILVEEDREIAANNRSVVIGPCMEYLLKGNQLELLVSIAIVDEPAGLKNHILHFISKILTHLNEPNIAHSSFYVPLMKLTNTCDGLLHSVYETQEIEFLLHLSAALRKQPAIATVFFSQESAEFLTEITDVGDSIRYTSILDLVLTYVDSADCDVRIKACQCILLLCSIEDETIAQCITGNNKFDHFLIGRLSTLYYDIPAKDYQRFKQIKVHWTLDTPTKSDAETIDNREAFVFFGWLDFISHLGAECHPLIRNKLCRSISDIFLKEAFNSTSLSSPDTFAIFCQFYSTVASSSLRSGFHEWLLSAEGSANLLELCPNLTLRKIIDNCSSSDEFLATSSLEFIEELITECDADVLYHLVLYYVSDRLYYDTGAHLSSWSDEEDERQKYSGESESLSISRTLAPSSIDRIVQKFVDLVPIHIRSTEPNEYMANLKSRYERAVDRCARFKWPVEATSDVENTSNDSSNPEVDSCRSYNEGPFLKMIFSKIRNFARLNHRQMKAVSKIVLELAILPHPFLHEYLLNPTLNLRKGVKSLFSCIEHVANDVFVRVQTFANYQDELRQMKRRVESSEEEITNTRNEIDRYLGAFVLLEKLCDSLATIAYIKYVHCYKSSFKNERQCSCV